MTSTLRARWRVRKEPLQGPKDHRCDPNSVDRDKRNRTVWHPDGIGPGETGYRVTVCPVCGTAWTRGISEGFFRWFRKPSWRGRITIEREVADA